MKRHWKTRDDKVDDLIHRWHTEYDGKLDLHEYMGLTWEDYKVWLADGTFPKGYKVPKR